MVSERNRIIELEKYFQSIGIDINIGKNKARGHKGVFMHRLDNFRIDVSKNIEEQNVLPVLLHEFAHYLHYYYDKSLKSLDFIFGDLDDELREELIKVTILDVPKDIASSLYTAKKSLASEIKELGEKIRQKYPDFKLSEKSKLIEKGFSHPLKYLLKYDRVRVFNKLYSIENLDKDFELDSIQKDYILLKSKQRYLKRVNSRINKLNRYYNTPTELFARFVEMFYTNPNKLKTIAPRAFQKMSEAQIPQLKKIETIING